MARSNGRTRPRRTSRTARSRSGSAEAFRWCSELLSCRAMTTPLWAPWRMEYLLGTNLKPGCFLCEHPRDVEAFRENLVLLVQPHAFVCLNRYPFTTSHLLVASRRHVGDLSDLEPEEYAA